MDWVLALCIAAAFIVGVGLLLVIGFASGEDASVVHHAREVANLKRRITELEYEYNTQSDEWVKVDTERLREYLRAEDLASKVKVHESELSRCYHTIRTLATEVRDLKKGPGDFALDA